MKKRMDKCARRRSMGLNFLNVRKRIKKTVKSKLAFLWLCLLIRTKKEGKNLRKAKTTAKREEKRKER
jgi:hypothetical protein